MKRLNIQLAGSLVVGDFGGDGPPAVLLHGIGGAKINWMLLAPLLAKRFRVTALDLPGFGETPLAGRSAGLDAQRDIVARYIREVVGGPVTLFGHSMGGLISMLVAAARPDLVDRIVLFDPAFPPRTSSPAPGVPTQALNLMSRAPGVFAPVARVLTAARGPEATVRQALNNTSADGRSLPPAFVDAHVEAEAARMRRPGAYTGYLQAWHWFAVEFADQAKLEAMVRSISAPAMLLHGELDTVVSPAAARRLAELQPGWALRMIPGIGHNPNFEAPDLSARLVFEWLDGAPSEGS